MNRNDRNNRILDDDSMYSHEWKEKQRKHDDDKIMKVLCRAIKAVMDYEWGKDGVNG